MIDWLIKEAYNSRQYFVILIHRFESELRKFSKGSKRNKTFSLP